MPDIDIVITDATGSKQQPATVPDDAPVIRIVARVVELLKMPLTAPDGQPMSYKFHHTGSGRQLRDPMTLAEAGVKHGDVLRLVPEITAGASPNHD
jgi:hypothetical protein